MSLVTKEQVSQLQKANGIPQHSHIYGLMDCPKCVWLVVLGHAGNPMQPLIDQLEKELGIIK